ncbi:MAG: DUF2939 domain-containing protein [Nitrospina sp.]|nr:DUF2939 domain-containing protein [Nitrospina sp.]
MRKLSIAFCILVLVYLIWPYIALMKLYIGLESADKKIVMEEIHWPPIRKGIEKNLNHFVIEILNKNLKQQNLQVSFSAVSLTRKIADEIATPEGIIYLYHHPYKYADQIRKTFEKATEPKQLSPTIKEKPLELEGPNVSSLWKRIDYIFFTDFSHFQASFNIKGKPFTIIWKRQGFDWKVVLLNFPLT